MSLFVTDDTEIMNNPNHKGKRILLIPTIIFLGRVFLFFFSYFWGLLVGLYYVYYFGRYLSMCLFGNYCSIISLFLTDFFSAKQNFEVVCTTST